MRSAVRALLALLLMSGTAFAFDPLRAAGIESHPGAQLPLDRNFRDENGTVVTIRALMHGKPALLVPVQHNCPNLCGITLGNLLQSIAAQAKKPGRDFTVIAFGIDPKEGPGDAAASRDRLLAAFPTFPKGAIHALTGGAPDIAAVTQALGYRYAWDDRLGQYDHVAATAVITPGGKLSHWLYGVAPEPNDIELALTEASSGTVSSWGDRILLLCYHYDPVHGRYSSDILNILRGLAGLTAAVLALVLARFVYREFRKPAEHPR
jgi:protein SCO1/2